MDSPRRSDAGAVGSDGEEGDAGAVALPIDGVLDLHAFDPRDVADLVPEYLRECRARGILEVRIVHGKGRGVLRRTVRSVLERMPEVRQIRGADELSGGWGATLVTLRAPDLPPAPSPVADGRR